MDNLSGLLDKYICSGSPKTVSYIVGDSYCNIDIWTDIKYSANQLFQYAAREYIQCYGANFK
jgi:hypothetical protein